MVSEISDVSSNSSRNNNSSTSNDAVVEKAYEYKREIVWPRVATIALLHLIFLYTFYRRYSEPHFLTWQSELFTKIYFVCSNLGITVGAHKLWSHRAFKANFFCESLIMLWASCTYQNSVFTWVRDHRLHHKYSETDADPHNAARGFFFSHVGWLVTKKHPEVKRKGHEVDMSDMLANPIVMFQHRHYHLILLFTMIIIPICLPHYLWGEKWTHSFLVQVYFYVFTVNLFWGINSFAHMFGTKPYNKDIGPVQVNSLSWIMWGEEGHNFHHCYPYDYRSSEYTSFDFRNLSTICIDTFAKLGWVTDRREVPKHVVQRRKEKMGDGTADDRPIFAKTIFFYLFLCVI